MYKKLIALILMSPLVISEELISLDEFFSSEKASSMNSAELTIYSLEKCSAVTFFSIGGDNPEIEDVGDIFLMTALAYRIDLEPEINDAVHMDNNLKTVQKYFKEYEYYYSDYFFGLLTRAEIYVNNYSRLINDISKNLEQARIYAEYEIND